MGPCIFAAEAQVAGDHLKQRVEGSDGGIPQAVSQKQGEPLRRKPCSECLVVREARKSAGGVTDCRLAFVNPISWN